MIIDCRAGTSMALATPCTKASVDEHADGGMTGPREQPECDRLAPERRSAWHAHHLEAISAVDQRAGVHREGSTTGNAPMLATSPTTNALFDSCSDSHPSAIVCIHDPISESVCPTQNRRKLRWVARTLKGLRDRGAVLMRTTR
jgi:hypothetical protein